MHSHEHEGRLVVRLNDTQDWDRELRVMVQTEKYIRQKNDAGITPTLKRILQDRADENRVRKSRIMQMLEHAIQDAEVCDGAENTDKSLSGALLIDEGLEYWSRTFTPNSLICSISADNPQKRSQSSAAGR